DGATSEGEFWESLNTACRLHLPVLYVVADNGYAISVRSADQAPAPISEMVLGIRGLHIVKMDGRDYFEVRRKGADAIAHVRAGAEAALAAPRPAPITVLDHVLAPPRITMEPGEPETEADASPVTLGEAIRLTLHEQMALDERIRVFGEDVADADPHVMDEV